MSHVLLGLGSSVDHEIDLDLAVVERLAHELGVDVDDLDAHAPVLDERDLVLVLLAFFATGSGGERSVATDAVVWSFSDRFDVRETVGGTPVRAAEALARLGVGSVVHLSGADPVTLAGLPVPCRTMSGSASTRIHPHLVVQFSAGDSVRLATATITASSSNRVILVHDPVNARLELSPELPAALAQADVVLLSGLNAVADPGHARDLVQRVVAMARAGLPAGSLVVYEDGGFHEPALGLLVSSTLAPVLGVHSMNEDELAACTGRDVDLLDPLSVARALDAVRVGTVVPTLVVHTRAWVAAVGPDPYAWRDGLRSGAALATARYVHGDAWGPGDHRRLLARPHGDEALALSSAIEAAATTPTCVVPTHALASPAATTVGLGDTFVAGFLAARVRGAVRPG